MILKPGGLINKWGDFTLHKNREVEGQFNTTQFTETLYRQDKI